MGKPDKAKVAARVKHVEVPIPCIRVPEHKSIPVDYHPEVGRRIKARGCETCKIVWKFIVFRKQGAYVLLAEDVAFPGGRA